MASLENEFEFRGRLKLRFQAIVVLCGVLLLAGKFVAFYLTNSAAILTDAVESIVNVVAGVVSLYSIRLAARPRDDDHPFGHGKIELISASLEGLMISFAGLAILWEGVARLLNPETIARLDIGLAIVAIAGVVNCALGILSIRVGRKYCSVALIASGKHLLSDTYSTIGLLLGLFVVRLSGLVWIDSVSALIFGSFILFTGGRILRKTIAELTDEADLERLEKLADCIAKNQEDDWVDVHNLKVICYGRDCFVDCDLTLPWFYNIEQGHYASERLSKVLQEALGDATFSSIHFDSCRQEHCAHCRMQSCKYRQEPLSCQHNLTLSELVGNEPPEHCL